MRANLKSSENRGRHAFTLVELLVVVAIIAAIIALLLPAVQAARETSRRSQCSSHLRQLVLSSVLHENTHRFFPTGGWAIYWTGDPDRGFGRRQPGGWLFNSLPFMEEQPLRDAGHGLRGDARDAAIIRRDATPIVIMNCPTRRPARPYPNPDGISYRNAAAGEFHARGDYAINIGDKIDYEHVCFHFSPTDYEDSDQRPWGPDQNYFTGISFSSSRVRVKDIKDGLGRTFAIGERYMNPEHYEDGGSIADNAPIYAGVQTDLYRCTYFDPEFGGSLELVRLPHVDEPGLDLDESFGSAHASGFQMTMCDGSTRFVPYEIDGVVYSRLGNRLDGNPSID